MLAVEAITKLISEFEFQTVLDIGSGEGEHSRIFKHYGKIVSAVDLGGSLYYKNRVADANYIGEYVELDFPGPFDCIWCSHVLEHQRNIGTFLEKIYHDLKDDGVLAITVPPSKPNIVGGHVTVWNAGLLLYNLILAGFDCSEASVLKYDYNISVILRKKAALISSLDLSSDIGDIEKLAHLFPLHVHQDFDGDLVEVNWRVPVASSHTAK